MSEAVERIQKRDRIVLLDAMRGIAILLILLMNIPSMGHFDTVRVDVTGWTDADQLAVWIQRVAFAGTARGMLQL
ncbi:MAG: hypothetical protein ACRC1J_06265, partial [Sandaracinobacteroides sp.]